MPAAEPSDQNSDATDQMLAHKAAGGCGRSFEALLERHYDRVHRLAWRWCGSREMAEDVAQDVCLKLGRAIRTFRGDAAFASWLHRIAYTTTLDHLRSSQRSVCVDPSELMRLVDAPPPDTVHDAFDGEDIWTAVRALPPQQRDAVLLIYGEDMSHAEAAALMQCSEKTVSWHVHEAKKKLKILLKAVG